MARYNEILVGRYNRRLQKLLGMKGEPPAPQLSTEISPSLLLFSGTEERYLEGWNHYAISGVVIEVGGATAVRIRLRNAPNSGVVGVVYYLTVSSSVGSETWFASLGVNQGGGDLPSSLQGFPLDARGNPFGSLIGSTDVAGGFGTPQIMRLNLGAANSNVLVIGNSQEEIVIPPGIGLQFGGSTTAANTASTFTLFWRERILEESERS